MTEKRTIRVTGKGQIRVKPDLTRIMITLEGRYPDHDETMRRSSEDTAAIQELLAEFGFSREDLVTLSFNVETEYEGYEVEGVYRQRLAGYRYRHEMKVEFDIDGERLGKILYALGKCSLAPEFRLSYTVKDPEKAKNGLLGKAVADARAKARVLADAAGVVTGDILNINYSWDDNEIASRPVYRNAVMENKLMACAADTGSYNMDIVPDDITVTDVVTILWEIKG